MTHPEPINIDELDLSILEHLRQDGRKPLTLIAEDLGIPYATIRYRLNRLLESGVLRIVTWLNPRHLGFSAAAHIHLFVDLPEVDHAVQQIKDIPEVTWLAKVIGEYNLMIEVVCRDLEHLNELLEGRLNSIPGLRAMETALYQEVYKVQYYLDLGLLREHATNTQPSSASI
jgi:Lrp/AsnC family transcriptional regulator for asnA, asnC and gidA